MKSRHLAILLSVGLGLPVLATAEDHGAAAHGTAHWGYAGESGPAHWGRMKEDFIECGIGKNQSPIDIAFTVPAQLKGLDLSYWETPLEVVNNGHTIQANVHSDSTLSVFGHTYKLLQFHFHAPSEHTIDGKHTAMEAHFVHKNEAGELLVLGVLLKAGDASPVLGTILDHAPEKAATVKAEGVVVDPSRLLPAAPGFYRYSGSLTTPPCSEGVRWYVMEQPMSVSAAQVEKFVALIGHNNRPLQGLNARMVLSPE